MKKYIILTASYGNGHNSATSGIKNYLIENDNQVLVIDMVDFINNNGKLSQKFYTFSSEIFSIIWPITFKALNTKIINIFLDYYLNIFYGKKFDSIIKNFNPDCIIGVYPLWQNFILHYIKKHNKSSNYGVFITDSTLSLPWYYNDRYIDNFFVIDDTTKNDLILKLPNRKNDIITTFFPIEEKYFSDKEKLNNKVISILLSGFKDEFCINFFEKLTKADFYDEIIIIKGRNNRLYHKLMNRFNNKKFKFIEYLNIKESLKNIDIFITKPGGALICECIAQDVFIISPSYIGGQEDGNIKLLENNKIGFYLNNIDEIFNFIEKGYLNIDMNNFKKIKNKNSIQDIINKLTI